MATETAPRWALCSDCRLEGEPTCPEQPQCWAPQRTADLPASEPYVARRRLGRWESLVRYYLRWWQD